MKRHLFLEAVASLLVLLFVYTAISKWVNFADFRNQMYNQTLPRGLQTVLIYMLPPLEILVSLLLLTPLYRLAGFWSSAILLVLFSGYVFLVLVGFYQRVPCSCGGVIKALGWKWHLVLNLFLLLLSILAIIITYRERRTTVQIR